MEKAPPLSFSAQEQAARAVDGKEAARKNKQQKQKKSEREETVAVVSSSAVARNSQREGSATVDKKKSSSAPSTSSSGSGGGQRAGSAEGPASGSPPLRNAQQPDGEEEAARTHSPAGSSGPAVGLTDESLVSMLTQPPKAVPLLRTKTGFQEFFRGVSTERMRSLLSRAYSDLNELERDAKVRKRMDLLGGVLVTE